MLNSSQMDKIREFVKEEIRRVDIELQNIVLPKNEVMSELGNFISGSSKKIRSIIALLYLKSNQIEINKDIFDILIVTELIHNASLLHDDVIDNAQTRRGSITISKKFSSSIAVLMGDYLLSIAVKKIKSLNNDFISDMYLNCTQIMSEAEIKQYLLRNKIPSLEEYIDIISGKTALLFETTLKSCAIIAGIDKNKAEKFGKNFGILFQLNNDMQQDSAENDRKNGINTVINILGIENTNSLKDNYRKEILSFIDQLPENKYKNGLKVLVELL